MKSQIVIFDAEGEKLYAVDDGSVQIRDYELQLECDRRDYGMCGMRNRLEKAGVCGRIETGTDLRLKEFANEKVWNLYL